MRVFICEELLTSEFFESVNLLIIRDTEQLIIFRNRNYLNHVETMIIVIRFLKHVMTILLQTLRPNHMERSFRISRIQLDIIPFLTMNTCDISTAIHRLLHRKVKYHLITHKPRMVKQLTTFFLPSFYQNKIHRYSFSHKNKKVLPNFKSFIVRS